jgi:hypothetical protein
MPVSTSPAAPLFEVFAKKLVMSFSPPKDKMFDNVILFYYFFFPSNLLLSVLLLRKSQSNKQPITIPFFTPARYKACCII